MSAHMELWVSTSEGRFQVVNADGQSEDTVEPANPDRHKVGDVLQAMFGSPSLIVPAAAVDNVIDAVLGITHE